MSGLKQYDMDSTTAVSDIGIQVSIRYLKYVLKYPEVINTESNRAIQKKDIDLIALMEDEHSVRGATVEVKTDRYKTGNLFFETISNIQKRTPGCLMYSEADWLHYFFTEYKHLYVMDMKLFREWMLRNRHRYKPRITSTGDGSGRFYTSEGIPIPLRDIRRDFSEFKGKCVDAVKLGLVQQ